MTAGTLLLDLLHQDLLLTSAAYAGPCAAADNISCRAQSSQHYSDPSAFPLQIVLCRNFDDAQNSDPRDPLAHALALPRPATPSLVPNVPTVHVHVHV